MIIVKNHKFKLDLLQNEANKEEFEGNTERSTAAYTLVREEALLRRPVKSTVSSRGQATG
ncbi:hypothetical protein RMONA_06250 [Rickettsia monacensis]|uniref:Uncharacterized protein n=1 Tax=Rickettsia monacensis TaxID=109232 RepID=A0A0B7J5J7_9RICK|nr:RPE1 domain protein [Rickettsia endosymbiont of Ixodes pacificus]CDI30063.1 rickettsial palindromic element RPE1 domain protein [Rickettsia monacensis IrR/Munich]CEO17609.1 hypothetical protein RMONA_06250 [Rickettsia monacensis]